MTDSSSTAAGDYHAAAVIDGEGFVVARGYLPDNGGRILSRVPVDVVKPVPQQFSDRELAAVAGIAESVRRVDASTRAARSARATARSLGSSSSPGASGAGAAGGVSISGGVSPNQGPLAEGGGAVSAAGLLLDAGGAAGGGSSNPGSLKATSSFGKRAAMNSCSALDLHSLVGPKAGSVDAERRGDEASAASTSGAVGGVEGDGAAGDQPPVAEIVVTSSDDRKPASSSSWRCGQCPISASICVETTSRSIHITTCLGKTSVVNVPGRR
jgi:hypothetical protein